MRRHASEAALGRLPMTEARTYPTTPRASIISAVAKAPDPSIDHHFDIAWIAVPFLLLTLAAFS